MEPIWKYEEYSMWSRQLAKTYSLVDLQKELSKLESRTPMLTQQHLKAIEKTTSMTSNSQRRAQSRNNVTANYEAKQAYRNAIELHMYYSEKCKK